MVLENLFYIYPFIKLYRQRQLFFTFFFPHYLVVLEEFQFPSDPNQNRNSHAKCSGGHHCVHTFQVTHAGHAYEAFANFKQNENHSA